MSISKELANGPVRPRGRFPDREASPGGSWNAPCAKGCAACREDCPFTNCWCFRGGRINIPLFFSISLLGTDWFEKESILGGHLGGGVGYTVATRAQGEFDVEQPFLVMNLEFPTSPLGYLNVLEMSRDQVQASDLKMVTWQLEQRKRLRRPDPPACAAKRRSSGPTTRAPGKTPALTPCSPTIAAPAPAKTFTR
jgi:hypothetical protein